MSKTPNLEQTLNTLDDIMEKVASVERPSLDAYDRARQAIEFVNKMATTGQHTEDTLVHFYTSTMLAEALLAVADAVYISKGLSRKG